MRAAAALGAVAVTLAFAGCVEPDGVTHCPELSYVTIHYAEPLETSVLRGALEAQGYGWEEEGGGVARLAPPERFGGDVRGLVSYRPGPSSLGPSAAGEPEAAGTIVSFEERAPSATGADDVRSLAREVASVVNLTFAPAPEIARWIEGTQAQPGCPGIASDPTQ